jgi:hypothetical protein
MSRFFSTTNSSTTKTRAIGRQAWNALAYDDKSDQHMIKNFHFAERLHYGLIDNQNNSIIPNESFLTQVGNGRLFDFVANSFSLARLNCLAAIEKGDINTETFIGKFDIVKAYSNPRLKYGRYLDGIFQYYNETHIPTVLGTTIITSYEAYVNNFFKFFLESSVDFPITMTGWNLSTRSSILDTGLAFSIYDIPFDDDRRKFDEIVSTPTFEYFKSLCLNMGFSISDNNPNILVYDLTSPAGSSIRNSLSLFNLGTIFNERYIKTYTIDNDILYNKINIYYNKYVEKNSQTRKPVIQKCKTTSEYIRLEQTLLSRKPFSEQNELTMYIRIRNKEEGMPYGSQKIKAIDKKAKYLQKKLDKDAGMSYINNMFRDQLWNKNNGFHDIKAKLRGKTETNTQRVQGGSPRGGGSSY